MKNRINPLTYLFILLFLLITFHFIYPIKIIVKKPYNYFGFLLILLGAILNIWANVLFNKYKTTNEPEEIPNKLITKGPFKISRNPMYFGMFLLLIGAAIGFGSLISFIFPVVFFLIIEIYFIPMEENNLKNKFKQKYNDYKKKVRRWI